MTALAFHIISADESVSRRWQKAFEKEGWPVCRHACAPAAAEPRKGAELDLIEIADSVCATPEELKAILQVRRPVSVLVFGDPKRVSNRQITALLEAGADDFVYKDLDERVLVAKLKAHMRRIMPAIIEASDKCVSSCGKIEVDIGKHTVTIKSGTAKCAELRNFTQRELDILAMLIGNEEQVVSREAMLERIWGAEAADVYSECVDKHIESLRRKLGLYGKRIRTIYGTGYMLVAK